MMTDPHRFDTLDAFYQAFPKAGALTRQLLEQSSDQKRFLTRRFSELTAPEARNLEEFAALVLALCEDDVPTHVADYLFQCDEQKREEMHFLRTGGYRLSTFAEAVEQVYSDDAYMTRYMNGQLMTQLWWSNHTKMLSFYREEFLAKNATGGSHLEIGPGHGLLLHLAIADGNLDRVTSWDVSAASIALTRHSLTTLGAPRMPDLHVVDMFDAPKQKFSSIVFSEVLEHLENPRQALDVLQDLLTDDGRLFVNVPINAPAPDHLFNQPTPSDMQAFIESAGFEVEDVRFFPATNYTLERAIKMKLTISCGFILRKVSNG